MGDIGIRQAALQDLSHKLRELAQEYAEYLPLWLRQDFAALWGRIFDLSQNILPAAHKEYQSEIDKELEERLAEILHRLHPEYDFDEAMKAHKEIKQELRP